MVNDGMAIKEDCPVKQCKITLNLKNLRNYRDFPHKLIPSSLIVQRNALKHLWLWLDHFYRVCRSVDHGQMRSVGLIVDKK